MSWMCEVLRICIRPQMRITAQVNTFKALDHNNVIHTNTRQDCELGQLRHVITPKKHVLSPNAHVVLLRLCRDCHVVLSQWNQIESDKERKGQQEMM